MRWTMSRFFLVTSIPRTLTLPDVGRRMVSMISTVVVFRRRWDPGTQQLAFPDRERYVVDRQQLP